jgi:iron complex transport system permease protein
MLPLVGPFPLSVSKVLAHETPDWSIFVHLRVSRVLLGLLAGGALSLAGALFQAMLRDALATPYTLGISSGASLGAVVAIWQAWLPFFGVPAVWPAALAGATVVLVLIVGASLQGRQVTAYGLLLSGLAANSVCSALILVIHGLVGASQLFSIARWLIGSVDAIAYGPLAAFAVVVVGTAALVIAQSRSWNLMAVDPSWAATRGTRVASLTLGACVAGAVLTASTVALTGPVGFVGLIVPHIVRTRIDADHRVLMPCAFLLGGVLLAGCDAIGRLVIAPAEVPAGAILALLGGPYLVWVLRQR